MFLSNPFTYNAALMAEIDKHVVYNLYTHFVRAHPIMTFYNIELNANFINYLESFAGLRTCSIEFKKRFYDKQFNQEYDKMIAELPVSNGILLKIRNIYHHARGLRLTNLVQHTPSNEQMSRVEYVYGISEKDLLNLTDEWNQKEREYLSEVSENGFIDVKKLITTHFDEYSKFLDKYEGNLSKLIQRKTGYSISLTI